MRTRLLALLAPLALIAAAPPPHPWEEAITAVLGRPGAEMPGGVWRVGLPRGDLHPMLDGVAIKPQLALGGWLAFQQHGAGEVMVMGDLVLTEAEVNPVMKRLLDGGLEITALHNHLLGASVHTMYMHVGGYGEPRAVAATLKAALALTALPALALSPAPAAAPAAPPEQPAVEAALGAKGKANNGVIGFTVLRPTPPRAGGMVVPDAMGSANAINFQLLGGGKAAITGDLVLAAGEVQPTLRTLRAGGVEVEALHNHMLDDEPRLFFMHFWAVDDASRLATVMRSALQQQR